ncbi:MAG: ankyrin repeat domain-containing protein, partial [Tatlockia sp.]|nr:ankyrin repeat domain-containing protein [Tatlockia sp.]
MKNKQDNTQIKNLKLIEQLNCTVESFNEEFKGKYILSEDSGYVSKNFWSIVNTEGKECGVLREEENVLKETDYSKNTYKFINSLIKTSSQISSKSQPSSEERKPTVSPKKEDEPPKSFVQEKIIHHPLISVFTPINKLQSDFNLLLGCFIKKDEEEIIKEFNSLISKYASHKPFILNQLNSLCLTLNSPQDKIHVEANLLHAVCKKGFTAFAERLIEFGVDIEASTVSTDLAHHELTPLLIAVQCNHHATVKLLLDKGANFLRFTGNSVSILMHAEDKDICHLIIEKAKKERLLAKLISYVSEDNKTVMDVAILKGRVDIVKTLIDIDNFQNYINPRLTLHYARAASWDHSEHSAFFEDLCVNLRKYSKPFATLSIKDKTNLLSEDKVYEQLFKQSKAARDNKKEVLKQALAQAASLFSNPEECIKYLSFLNSEFVRYYQHSNNTGFPYLESNTYEFKSIDGVLYPIPKDNYLGIKKEYTLEKILTSLFKPYDLAHTSYKWIGFIPHDIADKMILKGDFVIESAFGAGLFHNLTAHMLQQAMLIYMIQNKAISLEYQEKNEFKTISIKEFLQGFISLKVWTETRDQREFYAIGFNDPHRLGSIIMYNGHELGLRELADSLIDTFCKGFTKLFKAHEEIYSSKVSKSDFAQKMDDLLSVYFPTPKALIQYAITKEKKKGNTKGFFGDNYA